MQLHFTREELKLLAEILAQQASMHTNLSATSSDLLDRVIEHDFRLAFDELENLQDILLAYERLLQDKLDSAPAGEKSALNQTMRLFEQVKDKVTEACAMV